MKLYNAVQKLSVGDTQTDRQTGDLISLLSFFESTLKVLTRIHESALGLKFNDARFSSEMG
jgi:hypothetical protein